MAPPLVDDGGDGGRQKHSRKMKRLRDASWMRKRETRQDRWGRQRGGRKTRWEKLDRTPAGIKGSLSALGSYPEHLIHDPFDVVSPVGRSETVSAYSSEAEEDDDVHQSSLSSIHTIGDKSPKSPSPRRHQERTQSRSVEKTPPSVEASFSTPKGSGGLTKERKAMGAATLPLRGSNMGSIRGRRSLRSPASASLSRTSSTLLEGGSGTRLGAFRGSPPPLHRRFSAPGSAERGGASVSTANRGGKLSRKGRQRQHSVLQKARSVDAAEAGSSAAARTTPGQESRRQQVREGRAWEDDGCLERHEGSDEEEHSRTPPLAPNLFDSVFKSKLPSLTPRKPPPVTPRLSKDSVVHAIFQALFGKRRVRSGPKERFGGDWDDEVEDEERGQGGSDEEVDESWIKTGISLSLFSSKAVDFACRSTAGADLLHEYVDSNAVFRLVTDLRFEDPRVPSPRLMVVKAIYENCPHLRLPTIRALAHASHDHLMRTRELEGWAAKAGLDMNDVTAAAVAGGSKASGGARGAGSSGMIGGQMSQGVFGASVRVTGRDQSQTLGELLMYILETFPKFFLGTAAPSPAEGATPDTITATAASVAGSNDDMSAVAEDSDERGALCYQDGDMEVEPASSPIGEVFDDEMPAGDSVSTPAVAPHEGAASDVSGGVGVFEEEGCVANGDGNGDDDDDDDDGDVEGSPNSGGSWSVGDIVVSSKEEDSLGSPGGGSRSNATPSPGGRPVLAAEGDSPAWSVVVSPSCPLGSSPSSQSELDDVCGRAVSPARMMVTGLRELEDSEGGGLAAVATHAQPSQAWPVGLSAHLSDADDGVAREGDAWAEGILGGRVLTWASPEKQQKSPRADVAAGPARALMFTSPDDDDVGGGDDSDDEVPRAETGAPTAGWSSMATGEGESSRVTIADGNLAGIMFDQWAASNAAAKMGGGGAEHPQATVAPEAGNVPAVVWGPNAPLTSVTPWLASGEDVAAPVKQAGGAELNALEIKVAGAADGGAMSQAPLLQVHANADPASGNDSVSPSGLPATVLREAARSLGNLYACHGAAAAGGETASSADLPERLHPMAAAGSTLCQLWPEASLTLIRRLLGSWPVGSSRREIAYIRLLALLVCGSPPIEVMHPGSRLPLMLFRRLAQCINSPHTRVAQEASCFVQADFIIMAYLAQERKLMDLVTKALHANRGHWSMEVRGASERAFDLLLDFL